MQRIVTDKTWLCDIFVTPFSHAILVFSHPYCAYHVSRFSDHPAAIVELCRLGQNIVFAYHLASC